MGKVSSHQIIVIIICSDNTFLACIVQILSMSHLHLQCLVLTPLTKAYFKVSIHIQARITTT